MKVIKDFDNKLLKRREVKLVLDHSGNPGFESGKQKIKDHFKADDNLVVVNNVKGKFGRDTFLVEGYIYNSVEDKNKIEPKVKVKKENK